MDLFRLEIEDRQFLPLQRVRENLIEQITAYRDHKWLIADTRVNGITLDFSKRHRSKWLFARFGLSRVLGSERAESDNQLRLIQPVLRQIRSDIFDKFCDLLVLQRVDEPAHLIRICRRVIAAGDYPVFIFPPENCFTLARRVDGYSVENF